MTLLQSKPISSRMNVPASTRVIKSLIFEFPRVEGQSLSHEETLNQEVVEKTQEVLGMRPLLPLPHLTEAPVDVIAKLNKEQVIPKIEEGIKKIAREVMESTFSCDAGCEMTSLLNTLANYMRTMSLSELEVLKLREGHGPHVVGQSVQEGCHLTASVTGEGGLHNLTSNLLDTLLNLWDNLLLVQFGNDVNWSLSQMWEWEQWAHTQNLLGLLNNLLVKGLLMRKGLALNTWELKDQRLDDPGGGWDVHARGDWLGLKEGDGDHGWRDGLLLGVVA